MITPPTVRVSYIILTITLTVILISSPVIAGFSPSSLLSPIALKVEFASATSSSENNDDNEGEEGGGEEEQPTTDVTTDGEEEEVDGNSGDVQQEDNTEEEQQPSSSTQEQDEDEDGGEEEEEQLAFMAGEICDDFEDNDGDGFIDLVDADCVAPLTQGTVTAPTTPPPTSVTNTTATNSTANTLTAAGIAGLDRPYDLEKDCKTYEELGIPDPPLEPGDPPNVQWYDCPPGVGVRVPPRAADTTTTTTTTSGVEICNDFEDNDGDGFIDLVDADCVAPATQGTVTTSAPTTAVGDDGSITTTYPDGIVVTGYPHGPVVTKYPDGITVFKNGFPSPYASKQPAPLNAPGTTTTTYPGNAIILETPDGRLGIGVPSFGSAIFNPDGTSEFIPAGKDPSERIKLHPDGTQLLVFLMLQHLEMHSRS